MYIGVILQALDADFLDGDSLEPIAWQGRSAVEEMILAEYSNARQTEWPGWYFEFKVLQKLSDFFGGGPKSFGTTTFDYYGLRAWDLKTHSRGVGKRSEVILNDKVSMGRAIADGGLGYIVLEGHASCENEHAFFDWHNIHVRRNPRKERSPNSRQLKTAFRAERLDVYFIENMEYLEDLETKGILQDFNQGRQQDGSLRKPKYRMLLERARSSSAFIESVAIRAAAP